LEKKKGGGRGGEKGKRGKKGPIRDFAVVYWRVDFRVFHGAAETVSAKREGGEKKREVRNARVEQVGAEVEEDRVCPRC